METPGPDLLALYIQILGTFLFCVVFLFLWRQSGIIYFRYWSLAWLVQAIALLCAFRYFVSGNALWLAPYALFEFVFALSLMAAARLRPIDSKTNWKTALRVLVAFPVFLAIVYMAGLHSKFEGFHALHALVLGSIYLYSFVLMRRRLGPGSGVGGKLFAFSLLCLAIAFLHHAVVFFILYEKGGQPSWPRYLQYNNLYDFALHTLLAFSAMAMWIESQSDRLLELGTELDTVRREVATKMDLDRLTGLLNQAALAKRTDSLDEFSGVVAVCDMDNFKSINDGYGHLVGDEILRNIGNLLRSSIRQEDEAFRWGGDEFVILFHNQNLPMVKSRMQEIRRRLSDFRVRGHGVLPISFSWGTAEGSGAALRETLHAADQDMYAYKKRKPVR